VKKVLGEPHELADRLFLLPSNLMMKGIQSENILSSIFSVVGDKF